MSEVTFELGQIVVVEKEYMNLEGSLDNALVILYQIDKFDTDYPYQIIDTQYQIPVGVHRIYIPDLKEIAKEGLLRRIKLFFKIRKLRRLYVKRLQE